MSESSIESPQAALDDLMTSLERRDCTPTEVRVLLELSEREATPRELNEALNSGAATIRRGTARLDRQGLIRRRFERGPKSRFVLSITPAGLNAIRPLVEALAGRDGARSRTDPGGSADGRAVVPNL